MVKTKIPKNAKRIPLRPIAYGERTGHHHSLMVMEPDIKLEEAVEMYEKDGQLFIRITGEGVALVHAGSGGEMAEHKPHALPVGAEYRYDPQVENSDWGSRPVVD